MFVNIADKEPFIIAIFSGTKKPDDLASYLERFIDEYNALQLNGFEI